MPLISSRGYDKSRTAFSTACCVQACSTSGGGSPRANLAAMSAAARCCGDTVSSDEDWATRADDALDVVLHASTALDESSPMLSALARGECVRRDAGPVSLLLRLRQAVLDLREMRILPRAVGDPTRVLDALELEGGGVLRLARAAKDGRGADECEADLVAAIVELRSWPRKIHVAALRLVFTDAVGRNPSWAGQLCASFTALEEKVRTLADEVAELRDAGVLRASGGQQGFVI